MSFDPWIVRDFLCHQGKKVEPKVTGDAELESLGIKAKWKNQLNDVVELAALTENIKQTYYQDYKSAYDKDHKVDSSDLGYI